MYIVTNNERAWGGGYDALKIFWNFFHTKIFENIKIYWSLFSSRSRQQHTLQMNNDTLQILNNFSLKIFFFWFCFCVLTKVWNHRLSKLHNFIYRHGHRVSVDVTEPQKVMVKRFLLDRWLEHGACQASVGGRVKWRDGWVGLVGGGQDWGDGWKAVRGWHPSTVVNVDEGATAAAATSRTGAPYILNSMDVP